jgi:hypothetical protein
MTRDFARKDDWFLLLSTLAELSCWHVHIYLSISYFINRHPYAASLSNLARMDGFWFKVQPGFFVHTRPTSVEKCVFYPEELVNNLMDPLVSRWCLRDCPCGHPWIALLHLS